MAIFHESGKVVRQKATAGNISTFSSIVFKKPREIGSPDRSVMNAHVTALPSYPDELQARRLWRRVGG